MPNPSPSGMDRRRFLTVLGTTGAGTAVLSGCSTDRVEKLIPYLVQSEDQVPSLPTWYASTCTECSAGCGLHVKTREGRAIKLEGNPDHPVNAGTLCARGQAGLQGLYNPARLNGPMRKTAAGGFEPIDWDQAVTLIAEQIGSARGAVLAINGAGAGTFSDLLAEWSTAVGGKTIRWRPFDQEAIVAASRSVFGLDLAPSYDFGRARFILSLGADFLETWGSPNQQQRGYAESHGFTNGAMARHVHIGPRMSLTGLNADEWIAPTPGSETALVMALVKLVLESDGGRMPADASRLATSLSGVDIDQVATTTGLSVAKLRSLAEEFAAAAPSLAVAGGIGNQHTGATELAAAVHLLNYVGGNIGETVRFDRPLTKADGFGALAAEIARMDRGEIRVVLLHEANPHYAVPAATGFATAFAKVAFKISTAQVLDESAAQCDLVIPNLHALERWDDLVVGAEVRGLMQPVMEPVFGGRHTGDVLLQTAAKLGGEVSRFNAPSFEAHLKAVWAGLGSAAAAPDWHDSLRRGGDYRTPTPVAVRLAESLTIPDVAVATFSGDGEFLLAPYPHPLLFDGRGANKPWLLETPDPVTKLTWQSWIEIHPEAAAELDVRNGEIVEVVSQYGTLAVPVYVYPGIDRHIVAIPMGLGHTEYGDYAKGRGVNPLDLLGGGSPNGFLPYLSVKVSVRKTRGYQQPATTEGTPRQLGRGIAEAMPFALAARGLTVREAYEALGGAHHEINPPREVVALEGWSEAQIEAQKFGDYARELPKWGMTVDLSRCTGCSACITACYAENNIPTVGEAEILRGREMSWLRVERYWEGGVEGEPLTARFVPMMCQHCDNAPCEPVCPVYAAYHTPDGLNGQVYNRCVGTRYCGNNCPYKVRYFNWYAYKKTAFPSPLDLQLNPDVTVRSRGVMEKCTFCIQRIRGAQHQARLEDRPLGDGEVVTACAQACPSGALTFGNVKDSRSKVAATSRDHRAYHILEELNVRPSVTYLAKVIHPVEG